ncbi:uncharacterized protein MYCFIDRAFT_169676 [Pseudocercospora fijiensis CIRAD86]|uniref:Uncharacterized protein n=1 Tax=Pseudocercospora fijiensis (strain CIRAD86) TaxID=383855 RepID=N1QAH6_PSEFD|nr:uncharacterized protein MYCFIDRAFT_169676 [Pseudocercospora fijiensis CIRAD86]EME87947.1 hypothetical protein MYCFIDRAFT_169676 [Pseudocercospora fijiensis CIRAD86]
MPRLRLCDFRLLSRKTSITDFGASSEQLRVRLLATQLSPDSDFFAAVCYPGSAAAICLRDEFTQPS